MPWAAGSYLYRGLGRIDRAKGVASWAEAFAWLASLEEPIDEVQYWGHARWGRVMIDDDALMISALQKHHPKREGLVALRERLSPGALVWFRSCETFGASAGIAFAEGLADFLGTRVAGHTHIIGFHQSGLQGLAPGRRAHWDPMEGVAEGTPDEPLQAKGSRPWAPRTITCLNGVVPEAWFGAPS